jgi:hypothetical protein
MKKYHAKESQHHCPSILLDEMEVVKMNGGVSKFRFYLAYLE